MKFFAWIGRKLGSVTDRVICIIMVLLLSQVPTYVSQYEDVLAGAHEEARTHYRNLEANAARFGKEVMPFLEGIRDRNDPEASELAKTDIEAVQRYQKYDAAVNALNEASVASRPFVLASHFQENLHRRAMAKFEPNVPLTGEALVYAAIGLFVAIGLISLFTFLGKESYAFTKDIIARKRHKAAKNSTNGDAVSP